MSLDDFVTCLYRKRIFEETDNFKNLLKNSGFDFSELDVTNLSDEELLKIKEHDFKTWKKINEIYSKDVKEINKHALKHMVYYITGDLDLTKKEQELLSDFLRKSLYKETIEDEGLTDMDKLNARIISNSWGLIQTRDLTSYAPTPELISQVNERINPLIKKGYLKAVVSDNFTAVIATCEGVIALVEYVCSKFKLDESEVKKYVELCNAEGMLAESSIPKRIIKPLKEWNLFHESPAQKSDEATVYVPLLSKVLDEKGSDQYSFN